MKLTIQDGRDSFYTFDSNRILLLTATDEEQIKQVLAEHGVCSGRERRRGVMDK